MHSKQDTDSGLMIERQCFDIDKSFTNFNLVIKISSIILENQLKTLNYYQTSIVDVGAKKSIR